MVILCEENKRKLDGRPTDRQTDNNNKAISPPFFEEGIIKDKGIYKEYSFACITYKEYCMFYNLNNIRVYMNITRCKGNCTIIFFSKETHAHVKTYTCINKSLSSGKIRIQNNKNINQLINQ